MSNDSGSSLPRASASERVLQTEQAELLRTQRELLERQQQQNAILLPFLAQQEGFDITTDANGVITSISATRTPLQEQNEEIQRLFNERTLAALKGELPVDPALEESLEEGERALRTRLQGQFGPGYETTTPGIQTLADFFESAEILREGARTGQLTLAEQLGLTRQQQEIFSRQAGQDILRTAAVADPMAFAGAFGQVARGFGQALVPFTQRRQLALQREMAEDRNDTSLFGAGITAAGSAIGGIFSDRDLKIDAVPISRTKHGLPIYVFTRRDTGDQMIGVMADEVEELFPGYISTKDGYDMVNYRSLE